MCVGVNEKEGLRVLTPDVTTTLLLLMGLMEGEKVR